MSIFRPQLTDNACVNIQRMGKAVAAISETPLPVEFDPETLATAGVVGYTDSLRGQITTAHPHCDSARNEMTNYITHFSRRSTYTIYSANATMRHRKPIASIRVKRPAYMHSFAVTTNYVVLVEFPFVVNPLRLLLRGRPFIENFRWEPARGTRFHVFDRRDGQLRVHTSDAFFAFHHVNAFERDDSVIVDTASYANADIIDSLCLEKLRDASLSLPTARIRRYAIERDRENVQSETLGGESIELPRINYGRVNGRPYQFAYGVSTRGETAGELPNQLVKFDLNSPSECVWYDDAAYPGEPVFIPAPDAKNEDDGVVLSVVYDSNAETSSLLVIDAHQFSELARVRVPQHVPFGFHGTFLRQ